MKEGAASPPIAVAAAVGQDAALAGGIALEQQRSTKSKRAARVFDLIVGASLAAAAGHSIAAETNTLLESTTFLLLSLTGVVLFLAACGLSSIRSRAEFLDHKAGRAGLSFVAALLCAAAAPQQIPVCTSYGYVGSAVVTNVRWPMIALATALLANGLYNARVSARASELKKLAQQTRGSQSGPAKGVPLV
jgi:hypothetical protein|mmetsp:Transcript_32276/g.96376  ORF Transcript_32276/g.96376 Transcript_32276/m.96376 type:complete len:191 (+) Transcript_32276:50-622(+)